MIRSGGSIREMKNKVNVRKTYNILIRVAILLLTYGFIYREVFYKNDFRNVISALRDDFSNDAFLRNLAIVMFMMIINWSLETFKWRFLIGKIEKVGFFRAFQAVFAGVSVSSFTPNRVGEYFGRVYILKSASHMEGILITILGSMSQLLVTLFTGSIAMLVFIPVYLPESGLARGYIYYSIVSITVVLNFLAFGLFLNINFLNILKERILRNRLKGVRRFFRVFAFFRRRELYTVIGLSFLRYVVFSTQYFLLLRMFAVHVGIVESFMVISLVYFVMAVIPTIALTEIGIRGSVAIYFFSLLPALQGSSTEAINFGILSASIMIWIINLGIPAIIGSFFVFRLEFFRHPFTKKPN
jgi:hypothetical protein